jgi:GNAT superfamily N-acetyltransferase
VPIRIEPLGLHDRAAFSCGNDVIDRFLRETAGQRQERKIAKTFVAVDPDGDPQRILGYYTVVPHEFRGAELPDRLRKGTRVGNLYALPGVLLAQLGVSREAQGRGIAKMLIHHALMRAVTLAYEWGCVAIVTDPVDERARDLYANFDFTSLDDGTNRMVLATRTLIAALALPSESSREQ